MLNFPEARSYPAFVDVDTAEGAKVELVDQQGAAKLYRVTAC